MCLARDNAHIWASAYPNWIKHGNEAVPGTDTESRLFVFRRDGSYVGQKELLGRDYRDYVYLSPDGSCAVGKLFQDKDQYIINYWPLEDAPKIDRDPALSDNWFFPRRESRITHGYPQDIQFSADRRFVSLVDMGNSRITVLNVRTGRLLGTVDLVRPVKGFRRLFSSGNDTSSIEMDALNTDVTDGGTVLYALFTGLSHPRLERYSVKTGKRLSSVPISGEFTPYTEYNYANPLCRVTDGGRRLILVNAVQLLCIDTKTGRIQTRIDKEQACCESDDYFAAVSPDGRLAAISGCRAYTDVNWELQLWDLDENRCLGKFVADGRIGEIIYEQKSDSWLFGMESGRLCRLKLEKKEGKSNVR